MQPNNSKLQQFKSVVRSQLSSKKQFPQTTGPIANSEEAWRQLCKSRVDFLLHMQKRGCDNKLLNAID
ncbi:hypothetical protein HZ326_20215 [Fusarium oxysporum f. sp. albedinis]|nr:hypothetical protein HZ326_20215 [Fusarium oxysporum f. sp. albedinis]